MTPDTVPSSSSASSPHVRVHITGFGKFHGVPDNPSRRLVLACAAAAGRSAVSEECSRIGDAAAYDVGGKAAGVWPTASRARLVSATVLETSAVGSTVALSTIKDRFAREDAVSGEPVLFLHVGVSQRDEFSLEQQGVNEVGGPVGCGYGPSVACSRSLVSLPLSVPALDDCGVVGIVSSP